MKTIPGRGLILIGLAVIAVVLLYFLWKKPPQNEKHREPIAVSARKVSAPDPKTTETNRPSKSRIFHSFTKRLTDMTPDEKSELAKKFAEKFKPAADKWFKAYAGHLPFRPEDFTLDKFHSRLGDYMYTFMIAPDLTFTIQDSKDPTGVAKVSYLMSRKAAVAMITLPQNGFTPDLSVPITREDVIRMVEADTGVQFKPNEVIITPTAASCVINGGAYVELLPTGADPNNGLSGKVDLVFGHDGALLNYQRDPFF